MNNIQPEELLARIIQGEADPQPFRPRKKAGPPPPSNHWTAPILLERAAYLKKMARASEGWASDTIRAYPGHQAMLIVRLRNGPAESIDNFAQMFFVLEGRATLVTGGILENPRKSAPGETTGAAIVGGSTHELRPGDVVHVAAGVPAQFLVAGEKAFSCLVLRMQQIEEE